ncbi:MAG: proton-conducting transporter membrane subunit [Pirellulaceae bacterium]
MGKSAQFPLHVWLPDAMEGPTPVSALVHSATMVAAGVFLVARFYPVFCPEVLLVIAICGAITLFMAATIAITATDIKRVLAYSTVSQLGYMMLSLGLGGWLAGVMHLFTHAFFKSLLFMCSGSVIHAVHTNEMTEMGGLRKKMPWTSATMLIGCMAIAGAGFPFAIFGHHLGLSGYYSKDAIVEQAWLFRLTNPSWGNVFFLAAAGGAAITAFYMFRLWFMTFAGQPRNQERYDHAHESPPIMYRPLIVLSVFAIAAGWGPIQAMMGSILAAVILLAIKFWPKGESGHDSHGDHGRDHHGHDHHGHGNEHGHGHEHHGLPPINVALGLAALVFVVALVWRPTLSGVTLSSLLEQSRPAGTLPDQKAALLEMTWPNEHDSHAPAIKMTAGWIAFGTAVSGFTLAVLFYGLRKLDAGQAKAAFAPIHKFLVNKWWFDELYQMTFVQPAHWLAAVASWIDKNIFDRLLDGSASTVRRVAVVWENFADRQVVDGFVNGLASRMYATGAGLRSMQTGSLRQYVLFIVVGTLAVFVLGSFVWNYAFAG